MKSLGYMYRGLRMGLQIAKGARKLKQLDQPIVTIFGGKRAKKGAVYTKQAYECAQMLAARSYSVITGGGPGVMESALCGVMDVKLTDDKVRALGIGISGVDIGFKSACGYEMIMTDSFEVRKYLLTRFSQAFIIFPGGYGTMDELFEILNLIKLNKMPHYPVILVGGDYWHNLMHWIDTALKEGLIRDVDKRAIYLVDSVQEAVELVVRSNA